MCLEFSKYHGLGNDYLVYDCNRNKEVLSEKLIRGVCDRNYGLGSDGILAGPYMTDKGMLVRIYNPDGSVAEKSGNGVCIFAKYLKDAGYVQKKEFDLLTAGGTVRVRYNNELGTNMTISMGHLDFSPEAVGCTYRPKGKDELVDVPMDFGEFTYRCSCVSIGNPHCVLPYKMVTKGIVCDIGRKIEDSGYFVNGINTQIAQVIDRHNMKIEIYERGAGYTLASGSSACAAAGAMYKMSFVDSKVWVHMPGGKLLICVDEDWNVEMTGDVSSVGTMRLSDEYMKANGL